MIAILAILSLAAHAEPLSGQLMLTATGQSELSEKVDLDAFVSLFWERSAETELAFAYVGMPIAITDRLTIGPYTGAVLNWTGQGDIAPLASIWTSFDATKKLHLFAEGDLYFFPTGRPVYFGAYSADYDLISDVLSAGLVTEHVDTGFNSGGRLKIEFGETLSLTGTYLKKIRAEGQAIRITVGAKF